MNSLETSSTPGNTIVSGNFNHMENQLEKFLLMIYWHGLVTILYPLLVLILQVYYFVPRECGKRVVNRVITQESTLSLNSLDNFCLIKKKNLIIS